MGRVGLKSYWAACEKLIAELGLQDCVRLTGRVSDGELGAYYQTADVLVSMSEHEGVGIPLLEAMHHGVPVVAYSAAAIPETVGNAGVLADPQTPGASGGRSTSNCLRRNGAQALGRSSHKTIAIVRQSISDKKAFVSNTEVSPALFGLQSSIRARCGTG